ncbi:MAG TPA: ABC transporter permease [archaeon]|nr:ABC transporter permease [archaeon]
MFNIMKAIWYRNLVITKRSMPDLFSIFFWPLITPISMALFASFINSREAIIILLLGSISWSYAYSSQQDVSYSFLRDMWYRSVKKLRLIPTSTFSLIIGTWTYSIFRSIIVLLVTSGVALIFGFNLFSAEIWKLALVFFGMNLFGLFLGMMITSALLRFGQSAEVLAWSVVDALILISGIFYPVSVLPESIRWIAFFSPLSYALENLRGIFLSGIFDFGMLFSMYGLLAIYLIVGWAIFSREEKRAREKGFFQRYD